VISLIVSWSSSWSSRLRWCLVQPVRLSAQRVQNAWSDIDTELKRRYDLIPTRLDRAGLRAPRARSLRGGRPGSLRRLQAQGPAAASAAEGPFQMALGHLFAVAENYPELKANQNFLQLQATLADTEDRIQAARQIYNSNVQQFNTRIQAFPSNVIANMFHFQAARSSRSTPRSAPWSPRPRRWTSARSQRHVRSGPRSSSCGSPPQGLRRRRPLPAPEARRCSRRRAAGA